MIVIPMAGLSSRFKEAGYDLPKYMLAAHGHTIFYHSLISFKRYFNKQTFLFIALDICNVKNFIEIECESLGIKNYEIILLNHPTRGQAETVYEGIKQANIHSKESLTIFNIDTFRPNFSYPVNFDIECIDGYLETFIGDGPNWSNVLPEANSTNKVSLTAEKQEISKYCCTGLYYWRFSEDFCRVFLNYTRKNLSDCQGGEFYIAPMYNDLISEGKDVRFSIIDNNEVIFCGIPAEYDKFREVN